MTENEVHEDRSDPAELPVTWGLFVKLEMAPMGELEDVWDYAEAAEAEIGIDGLHRGWHLVAAWLRQALQEHAQACDCGSDSWLQREQAKVAEWAAQQPDDPFEGESDE